MDQIQNTGGAMVDSRLAEYRELLAQFEAMRERLRRAEDQRQSVPRRVYDRVRAEYDREMDALRARMTPLRDELDQARAELEASLKSASEERTSVEEELQELIFRCRIGEFSEADMASRRSDVDARISGAQSRIDSLRASLAALDGTRESRDAAPAADAGEPETSDDVDTPLTPDTPAEIVPDAEPSTAPLPAPVVEAPVATDVAPAPEHIPSSTDETPEPPTETRETATPAHTKRPILRQAGAAKNLASFENPHDWIDEIGRDLARRETAPAQQAATGPDSPVATRANPVATPPPSLVFVSGPHAGQSIPLLQTTLTIGREHDNNIEIKDAEVARYHARILNERGDFVVEDMGSTTGTWVNGEQKPRATLGHGDVIKIGQTEIAVDFEWASNSLERAGIDPAS